MITAFFDNLKGIRKERKVKDRGKTNLEYLLEISQNFMYRDYDTDSLARDEYKNNVYERMYEELKKKSLSNIIFNEEDLTSFIFATASSEYEEIPSLILGLYSGCLLHLLTERNKLKNKRTEFYINGHGNRFDYLFYYAKKVDRLIVENFTGNYLCSRIGSFGGKVNQVIAMRIEGSYVFSNVGSDGAEVNQVIGVGIKGNEALTWIGYNGKVNQLIGVGIIGYEALKAVGSFAKEVIQVIGTGIKGYALSENEYNKGKVKQLIIIEDVSWMDLLDIKCKKIIPGREAHLELAKYQKLIDLVKSLKNKSYPEILEIANNIYSLRDIEF